MRFRFSSACIAATASRNVSVIGISQNNARDTQKFMKEFGVTFPVALDDPANYAVSNAYGLTNVPTLFYIDSQRRDRSLLRRLVEGRCRGDQPEAC